MRAFFRLTAVASCLLPALVAAREAGSTPEIKIDRAVVARTVEGKEPAGEASAFPRDVGQIVCFTQVEAPSDTTLYHVWRHGATLHAKVELSVHSGSFRTWSRKRIHPSWTGDWTVDIEDETGKVLKTVGFTIGAAEGEASSR